MTLQEIDELVQDTQHLARVQDKVQLNLTLGVLEIARQLIILNEQKKAGKGR
jgi:hypothetical protein